MAENQLLNFSKKASITSRSASLATPGAVIAATSGALNPDNVNFPADSNTAPPSAVQQTNNLPKGVKVGFRTLPSLQPQDPTNFPIRANEASTNNASVYKPIVQKMQESMHAPTKTMFPNSGQIQKLSVNEISPQRSGKSLRDPMGMEYISGDKVAKTKTVFFRFRATSRQDPLSEYPAIFFHVNPQNIRISMNKIIDKVQTRGGFVFFNWGDDIDVIQADGVAGSFLRPHMNAANASKAMGIKQYTSIPFKSSDGVGTDGLSQIASDSISESDGNFVSASSSETSSLSSANSMEKYMQSNPAYRNITELDRRDTWPYHKLSQLVMMYRSNGIRIREYKLQTPNQIDTSAEAIQLERYNAAMGRYQLAGGDNNPNSSFLDAIFNYEQGPARSKRPLFTPIECHYDGNIYIGFFQRFDLSEAAENPYTFSYSFTFNVLKIEYNRVYNRYATLMKNLPSKVEEGDIERFANYRTNQIYL